MQNLKRYTMLVAAVLLTACGGDGDKNPAGPGGNGAGSFTATASGDVAASFSGLAAHASVAQGEDQGFGIAMDDTPSAGTATASIIFVRENPSIPGTGSHPIVTIDAQTSASEFVTIAALTDAQGGQWLCTAADEGTMTIQSASSSRVRGSFSVEMECQSATSEATKAVTFAGSFDTRAGTLD